MKYRHHFFLSSLTAVLLSACGGASNNNAGIDEIGPLHPVFNRNNVTHTPSYSPSGDITDNTPTFSWKAVAGATKYHFGHESVETESDWFDYIVTSAEAGCPNVGDTCEYTPDDYTMPFNLEKVWWIREFSAGTWQEWSRPIVFMPVNGTTNIAEAPTPLTPSGVINTAFPEFTWESVDGASNYKLGYENTNLDNSWEMVVITDAEANCGSGGECSYSPADPNFTSGKDFTWWLKTEVNGQWSDWSDSEDFSIGQIQTERPFKFKVKGYVRGGGNNAPYVKKSFKIATDPAYSYHYNVDCNDDGVLEATNIVGDYTCQYPNTNEYTISISGIFPHFLSGNTMTDVTQWGTQKWHSMENAFIGLKALTATDMPDLSAVTSMKGMFSHAQLLSDSTIPMWDVSHVTNMENLFRDAEMNINISNWDVSQVTNMSAMFLNNRIFNQDIGNWDVSNVTDMSYMLQGNIVFNQSLNNWDVGNVTNMQQMFHDARMFNKPLSNWNTGKVTTMLGMLASTDFNQPINSWDVSHVENFGSLFQLSAFNQDISDWDVSQATRLSFMFNGTPFNQDISAWDVSNVTTMHAIFDYNSAFSTSNYDRLLTKWSTLNLKSNVDFGAKRTKYSASSANARQRLINNFSWTIKDAGQL